MTTRPHKHPLSDDEASDSPKRQRIATTQGVTAAQQHSIENIYLDTIDRKKLDFDFEKICSVTLSNINIYGCLVCGKYFQGRGKSSPAYFHSLDEEHHVYINFNTLKVYLLPENKLVESNILDDIKYIINPTYKKDDLKRLSSTDARDLSGESYTPGFIGLNNIKANDYANVVLQLLSHVKIVRNFLLTSDQDELLTKNELNKRFTLFVKKLWSPRLFKHHISPHELLQHITVLSNKRFTITEQKSPRDFLLWLVNSLHQSFTHESSSVFSKALQGKLQISTHVLSTEESESQVHFKSSEESTVTSSKFWMLTLDLPPVSLFRAKSGVQEIPQIRLEKLLEKYDGNTETVLSGKVLKYAIAKYPPFLILNIERFKDRGLAKDLQVKERNQTIVQYPLELEFQEGKVKYRLIGNVVHDMVQSDDLEADDQSVWKVQLRNGDEWFEIRDLEVKRKEAAFMFLGETCLQLWERVK